MTGREAALVWMFCGPLLALCVVAGALWIAVDWDAVPAGYARCTCRPSITPTATATPPGT